MRILLLGSEGQVGWELRRTLAPLGELSALERTELDLTNPSALRAAVRRSAPDVLVNAAAYTAVDKAETDRESAFAVNAVAPGVLAEEVALLGALLVHYSTDYVFDGAGRRPYVESDPTAPLSVYGRSKLAGEQALRAAGCRHLVLRTSWVYSLRRSNFVLAVLRRAREERRVRVVTDQWGTPTSACLIAEVTARVLAGGTPAALGLFHLAARGVASRFEFAREALALVDPVCVLEPANSDEFALPARRPPYSALSVAALEDAFGVQLPDWREDLARCVHPLRAPEPRKG